MYRKGDSWWSDGMKSFEKVHCREKAKKAKTGNLEKILELAKNYVFWTYKAAKA